MEKNRGDMVKKVSLFLAIFEKEGKIVKTEKGYQATQERMDELMTKNIEAKKKLMEQPPKYTDKKRIDFATNKNPF